MDRYHGKPKVGEVFDTVVEAVGEKGDGVCKKDGFVIFVPGVKQGEKIKVKVTKVFRKIGFGELAGKSTSQEIVDETPEKTSTDDSDTTAGLSEISDETTEDAEPQETSEIDEGETPDEVIDDVSAEESVEEEPKKE